MRHGILRSTFALVATVILSLGMTAACGASEDENSEAPPAPLKIGLLMNFSEETPGRSFWRKRGFDLAMKHVNEAGGVFSLPVESSQGDTKGDSETAAREARRLVEAEGVHAIVGPSSSANSLAVAEGVTGPAGIPTISASATSPMLTNMIDNDFFFRAALSDTAQGPVLARVTRERGFANVAAIYVNDAWGQGLAESFGSAWTGKLVMVAVERDRDSYLPELRELTAGGAEALVVIVSEREAETIIRESIENRLFDRFTFGDAAKSPNLVKRIGGGRLADMYGTAGTSAPESASSASWERAFLAEYGELPSFAYVKETYDAVIAISLAAEAAGQSDGAAIRDRLRSVTAAPGEPVIAGPDGVAEALRIIRGGGEVNYEGAAATLDWDANGDLVRGHIGIWRYTADDRIDEVEAVTFEFEG